MRSLRFRIASCALLLLVSFTLSAADWTQFRGPGGLGVSADKGLPTEWDETKNVVWKTELPGPGTSSPVFYGKKIFITSFTGFNVPGEEGNMDDLKRQLVCLDRATGKQLWSKDIPTKLPEQDRIRDNHGYASNTPAVDAQRVYVFCGKSGVFAFDHTGKQLWQTDVGEDLNGWGSAASPVVSGKLLYVNASVESQTLYALDAATGKEVWSVGKINESWNTPILVTPPKGKAELVVAIQGKVLGYDPLTGTELWSCKTDIPWYMVPSLVTADGVVYCIGGRNPGGALAIKTGGKGDVTATHRLWTGNKASNVSSPVLHNGYLYWMHDNQGMAFCADAKTGEIQYQERIPRADQVYASALLGDGKIYYVGRGGRTFVVAAKPEFELLATNDLDDRSAFNSTPVAVDGRLFLRSDKYLYCLGK